MGRPGGLLPGLLLALLAGCAVDRTAPGNAFITRFRNLSYPACDAFEMKVALIERRLGDPYLDKEVWTIADEQVVEMEQKTVLEDNGFRVGQVVGMTPAGLQSLLTSDRAYVNGRCYFLGQGKSATLALAAPTPHCCFQVIQHSEPAEVRLDDAGFTLVVEPHCAADGRIRLHCTPQAELGGAKVRDFRIAADGSGLEMETTRPCKTFPGLTWDITVVPNQYVLVGGLLTQPDRLGYQCFTQSSGVGAVQRLLVIRINRLAGTGGDEGMGEAPPRDAADLSVPLALQATWANR
jgi:hypothetical protein